MDFHNFDKLIMRCELTTRCYGTCYSLNCNLFQNIGLSQNGTFPESLPRSKYFAQRTSQLCAVFRQMLQVCSWPQSCGLYQAPWLMGVVQFPLMWRKCKIKWGNEGTKWITFEHGSPNCETFSWIITSKLLFNYNLIIDWEVDNQQGRKSGPNPLVHRLKAHWQSNFHQNVFVKSWV